MVPLPMPYSNLRRTSPTLFCRGAISFSRKRCLISSIFLSVSPKRWPTRVSEEERRVRRVLLE